MTTAIAAFPVRCDNAGLLAAATAVVDKAAWLWDLASGSLVSRLDDHDDVVQVVAFGADAGILATSASASATVQCGCGTSDQGHR